MKKTYTLLALSFIAVASSFAQDGPQRPPQGGDRDGHRPPPPPLITALDANHDGMIDSAEIDNASAALKTLDKNNDGKLTQEELRPPRFNGGKPGEGHPKNRGDQKQPRPNRP